MVDRGDRAFGGRWAASGPMPARKILAITGEPRKWVPKMSASHSRPIKGFTFEFTM